MKIALLVLTLLFVNINSFATLHINIIGEKDPHLFNKFLNEIDKILPEKIKSDLKDKDIRVLFKEMNENIAGKAQHYTILLNQKIKNAILSHETIPIKRTHLNAYKEAQATLIHEIIHVWDKSSYRNNIKKRSKTTRLLSQDPRFLYLSGWKRNANASNRYTGFKHRSPDIYEASDPQEFLAVNMEYFLLDPGYSCRRPLLYQFFKDKFNHLPFSERNCDTALNYLSLNPETEKLELASIDLNRLYQVHYFLAGRGKETMSRFGHSMIRLIICAPNTPFGPKCLNDLSNHIVLSYRAMIKTPQINSIAGLTGKYPSRLFFFKLNEVVDEYTKGEMCDILSIPLQLSTNEMRNIVLRALELHWSYDGKYYFISNNCAVETINLFRSGIKDDLLYSTTILTPNGLLDLLVDAKRANLSVLKPRNEAIRKGYIFDSYSERYSLAFSKIKDFSPKLLKNAESYFELNAKNRFDIFKQASKGVLSKAQLSAFLLLENGAFRRANLSAFQSIEKSIQEKEDSTHRINKEELQQNLELLANETYLTELRNTSENLQKIAEAFRSSFQN